MNTVHKMLDRSKQEIALYSYIRDTTIRRISVGTRIPGSATPPRPNPRKKEAQLEVGPDLGSCTIWDGLVIETSARRGWLTLKNPVL